MRCLGGSASVTLRRGDQKILMAFFRVIHTPQARGMATKAQNSRALASRPPLPMPYEPPGVAKALLALAACNFATSSADMCHLALTGRTSRLQIRPATSMAQRMYMVVL